MYFVRSIYYWGSGVEALPKGVIAVDLQGSADLTSNVKEVGLELCSQGFFDDSCWSVGCTQEDVDLVVKSIPHEKYGTIGQYLTNDQIIPDWQYELVKQHPNIVISEHSLSDMEDLEYCDCE